jgi:hypothetical protein
MTRSSCRDDRQFATRHRRSPSVDLVAAMRCRRSLRSGIIPSVTEPGWTPFGLTDDERVQYDVLVSGVPEWILDPVLVWLTDYFTSRSGWVDQDLALTAQLVT